MDEIADLYREIREERQRMSKARRERAEKLHNQRKWITHTPYHWGRWVDGDKLDFWPTKNKWMYRGKVRVGGLYDWLLKRKIEP